MSEEGKILMLSEIIEQKLRKEQEIEYYQQQLEDLTRKISFLQKEVDLTTLIIGMIENEKILDIEKSMLGRGKLIGKDNSQT